MAVVRLALMVQFALAGKLATLARNSHCAHHSDARCIRVGRIVLEVPLASIAWQA